MLQKQAIPSIPYSLYIDNEVMQYKYLNSLDNYFPHVISFLQSYTDLIWEWLLICIQ